jgi:hypothetical protein
MQIIISKQESCILSSRTWPWCIHRILTECRIQVRIRVCRGQLAHRRVFAFYKACILVFILVFIPCATLPFEQPTLDATVSWYC